ncbi:MAG: AAA family ATPase [Promethearchaeota archaeon]
MLKPNFLICLVGLPASGKTTFAKKFKKFLEQNRDYPKVKIVDPDKIRSTLTPDEFDYNSEQRVRKDNLKQIENGLKKGFIVISDDLNYYSSMRHDLKLIADRHNLMFFIIHISTPLRICLQWNEKREENLPNSVIEKIAYKFDNFDKYKWDCPIATINPSEIKNLQATFDKLMEQITYEIEKINMLNNKEISLRQSSNQNLERLDRITRLVVSEVLRNSEFNLYKTKILKLRKLYVKTNKKTNLEESEISRTFKDYLEKHLNLKRS